MELELKDFEALELEKGDTVLIKYKKENFTMSQMERLHKNLQKLREDSGIFFVAIPEELTATVLRKPSLVSPFRRLISKLFFME